MNEPRPFGGRGSFYYTTSMAVPFIVTEIMSFLVMGEHSATPTPLLAQQAAVSTYLGGNPPGPVVGPYP